MLWKFTTLPAAMFLFCPVYASFGRRHSEATVFRVAEHAAGHTQVSSPTVSYHHLTAGLSEGQPPPVTPADVLFVNYQQSAVPEAVHPQAPMVTEQVPSRETGSVSYKQGAGNSVVHSQAFPGTPADQETSVPKYQKQVANSPSVTLQGSTSRSVPPADTANRARLVDYIQIEDDSSDPGSPPPPSIFNSQPCIKTAGPSALPSCSSQPGNRFLNLA
ncbi:hypothetical protein PGTUg99_029279 [Puccinia graminis f. sp. tritici]|uniref:Uncharacterized protein n=1 Tax=Puccinia graminis f. sp. tritici TaxID=56615 RepID=A0A5B0RWL5_PUCGR|nr:hypothetical protein PGTUg99_029279 [Puccinia graminis f. sp. tritici]